MPKPSLKPSDPLAQWLAITWERPERSYNPELRDFFAGLLGYPKARVVTEDKAPVGYPDLKLLTDENAAWVVGDLKKDDNELLVPARREALWRDKRKYMDGLTRYVVFITARYLYVVTPENAPAPGFDAPLDLQTVTLVELQSRLAFLRPEVASHARQWDEFVEGGFPYAYLTLDVPESLRALRSDLRASFDELVKAAAKTLLVLEVEYADYQRRRAEIENNAVLRPNIRRRSKGRLDLEFSFVRHLFEESLDQFEEQYGREVEANKPQDQTKRVREAFVADSVAALIARVLFLRLVEDLHLQARRISNGGPRDWARFVSHLTGDARALVRLVSEDLARVYREPFAASVFDWIERANGDLDKSLQRLILRLNAYDFSGLSEEILGDIYQQFLPPAKRKQLGEFYTPPSVVEWILDHTVRAHGLGTLLDPSCGSGSFLVRYAHWRLESARRNNFDIRQVSTELQREAWGFDINPFASFISLFQMLWAVLRFDPTAPAPHIEVYNLNSLLRDTELIPWVGADHLPAGSKARDEQKWKYVVGNPPYIRAERVKYGEEMRAEWTNVWGQNADTGLVVLYRALTEWLELGGWLGMVVSAGYANSESAGKVWQLLHPGKGAAVRKVVWLEFTKANEKTDFIWDAAVIPMILIIEKTPAQDDDEIELHLPTRWRTDESPSIVRYADFFDTRTNPRVSNEAAPFGDYLLPLLESGDIPLLQKLNPNGNGSGFDPLRNQVRWTYGIQRGGVDVTETPTGARPVAVVPGQNIAAGWGGEPIGWIDLDAVAQRPNGKLSLWRNPRPAGSFVIQVATISPSLAAAVGGDYAALNSVLVGEANTSTTVKAVAAYLNSSLARYYWALKLRSAVLRAYRATIYPRNLDVMPWPKNLSLEAEQTLADGYDRLAELAARAKNNPNEWLLSEAETRFANAATYWRVTEPALGLRFDAVGADAAADELQHDGSRVAPLAEFADADLAEFVFLLLTLTAEEGARVETKDIQKLLVPRDYAALLAKYRARTAAFGQVEQDFALALRAVDTAVYTAFSLTNAEQATVAARMSRFPLDRLQPRYPWQTVRPRPIKSYTSDRFA